MDVLPTVSLILVCLLLEGFFSGSEIGVVSADQMKLRHAAAKGSRGARLALDMLKRPEWLLSTTLVGTNISVVTTTTLMTALMIELFGEGAALVAIVVAAPLIWVLGEIVPKSVFQQHADTITPVVIFPLRLASYLFSPILVVFSSSTKLLTRMAGSASENPFTLREEIIMMLQMPAQEGDIEPAETAMIRRMFRLTESSAGESMVPLIDVAAIEKGATRGEALELAARSSHARLPVYDGRVDRIVGVLHALDILGLDPSRPIAPDVRPARYVPGTKSNRDLLLELREAGDAMTIVVDEFGGAEGIITIEDIMEEIVEELEDEYDGTEDAAQWIRELGDRNYLVSARTRIDTLVTELDLALPSGSYTTVAGLLLAKAREIPPPGTVIEIRDVSFTVKRATPQMIQEVQVRW